MVDSGWLWLIVVVVYVMMIMNAIRVVNQMVIVVVDYCSLHAFVMVADYHCYIMIVVHQLVMVN